MAENKISQEELEKVQSIVSSLRENEQAFFKASVQQEELKQAAGQFFAQMQQLNQQIQAEMQTLKDVYGDIVINLETGEYQPAPTEEVVEAVPAE